MIIFGRQYLSQNLRFFLRIVGSASYVQQSRGKVFAPNVYDMALPFLNDLHSLLGDLIHHLDRPSVSMCVPSRHSQPPPCR